ncbi:MAG: serine hydrolase domain-containing protein [Caulobacter sp.]|nr:serine hydrolase domain-containing protein [Caulobacter sp.]
MDAHSQWTGLDAGRLERITDHIERNYIQPGKINGCQVQVTRRGHTAYARSFGQRDSARGTPWSDDTIVRIYSMTKPITSVALMTLFEQGLFQLDDPVHRFVPEWRNHRVWVSGEGAAMVTEAPKRPVSFRDVLSHTSGLTYGSLLASLTGLPIEHPVDKAYDAIGVRRGDGETLDQFLGKLGEVPLRYHPGEQWMYSLATDVCGALVERISGMPFETYLKKTIFDPLGMTDTAFHVPTSKIPRFAANYMRLPNKSLRQSDDPQNSPYLTDPVFQSGGGGLVGTMADYVRFAEMLRGGGELDGVRIIGPRTLDLMTQNHLKGGVDLTQLAIGTFSETSNAGIGFGLGFAMTIDQTATGGLSSGDYYWGGAASTIFWVDPKEELTVVFMTQLMPSASFDFRGQLKSLVYSAIVD